MNSLTNSTETGTKAGSVALARGIVSLNENGCIQIDGELDELQTFALRIARQRARFHRDGSAKLLTRGQKQISRAEAKESGRKVRVKVTVGSGGNLDGQAVFEMFLAARGALLVAKLDGLSDDDARASANHAARTELYHSTREPVYADAETASRARDKAFRRARESWSEIEPKAGQAQPHSAEFLATDNSAPVSIVARGLWRARRAIRATWAASKSNFAATGCKADLLSLREIARDIMAGIEGLNRWRDDAARAQRLHRLAHRAQAGFRLLDGDAGAVCVRPTPKPAPVAPHAETMLFPMTREEHWEDDLAHGQLPVAERILSRSRATGSQLAELAALFGPR